MSLGAPEGRDSTRARTDKSAGHEGRGVAVFAKTARAGALYVGSRRSSQLSKTSLCVERLQPLTDRQQSDRGATRLF